jgi:hypothetical protein
MLVQVSVCVAHRNDVCKRRQFYDPYHGSSVSRKFSDSRQQRNKYSAIRSMHNHSAKSSNARLLSFRSKDCLIGGALGEVASIVCKNAIERRVTLNQWALTRTALLTSDLRSDDLSSFSLPKRQMLPSARRISDRRTISDVATDIDPSP